MPNRVFIIHGWEARPTDHWLSWLKRELEHRGFSAVAPAMPNAATPIMAEWVAELKNVVGEADEQTYFVGHSLGVIAILRYLETLPKDTCVGGVVSVAGFSEALKYDELLSFFPAPLGYPELKTKISHMIALYSDNDPYVPTVMAQTLERELGAELISIPTGGHLNRSDGFTKLPEALDAVLSIAGRKK